MPHELSTEKLGPVTSMIALSNQGQKVGPEKCKCYFKLLHGSIYYPQTSQIRKSFELIVCREVILTEFDLGWIHPSKLIC
jgi:hypothetical protein